MYIYWHFALISTLLLAFIWTLTFISFCWMILQKAFEGNMLLKVHTSWYKTNLFPLGVFGQIKLLIGVQNHQWTRKAFLEQVFQAWLWISYLNHKLFSNQKCSALSLALVDFNIFWIFVMIALLNTTSLLIAIKILVYLFALFFFFFWPSCSNHCFAALALGAGVEQPFGCLIVQNRQGMQSMGTGTDLGSSGP